MSSGNAMLDGILWGDWRWPSSDVTYYFAHQNEGFEGYSRNWSSVEQNAYRTALQSWANVANVTFTEVSSPGSATFIEHVVPQWYIEWYFGPLLGWHDGDRLWLQGQGYSLGSSGDGDALLLLSGGGTIELNGIAPAGFQPGFLV